MNDAAQDARLVAYMDVSGDGGSVKKEHKGYFSIEINGRKTIYPLDGISQVGIMQKTDGSFFLAPYSSPYDDLGLVSGHNPDSRAHIEADRHSLGELVQAAHEFAVQRTKEARLKKVPFVTIRTDPLHVYDNAAQCAPEYIDGTVTLIAKDFDLDSLFKHKVENYNIGNQIALYLALIKDMMPNNPDKISRPTPISIAAKKGHIYRGENLLGLLRMAAVASATIETDFIKKIQDANLKALNITPPGGKTVNDRGLALDEKTLRQFFTGEGPREQ
jgi:hypothetical protein